MYLWDANNNQDPDLDGDLDNGIVAHEYGHGISNRLTGGPSTTLLAGVVASLLMGAVGPMAGIYDGQSGKVVVDRRSVDVGGSFDC